MARRLMKLVGVPLLLAAMAACTIAGPSAETEQTVAVGDTVDILIGYTNQSARWHPVVLEEPDFAIVSYTIETDPPPRDCDPGGCDEPTRLVVTGVSPGVAEFVVQECFVERPDQPKAEQCSRNDRATTYTVTVEE